LHDPAHAAGEEEARLAEFRRVREELQRAFVAYGTGWRTALRVMTE